MYCFRCNSRFCLGFLWFNAPPAKIFMGDTGSLALGSLLGTVSLISKHEVVLLIAGGLFVLEALSVIIQVFSFKVFGKRVFKMALYTITLKKRVGRINYSDQILDNIYNSSFDRIIEFKIKVDVIS